MSPAPVGHRDVELEPRIYGTEPSVRYLLCVCCPVVGSIFPRTLSFLSFQMRKAASVVSILYSLVAPGLGFPDLVCSLARVAARTLHVLLGLGQPPPFIFHIDHVRVQTVAQPAALQSKSIWSISSRSPQVLHIALFSIVGTVSQNSPIFWT